MLILKTLVVAQEEHRCIIWMPTSQNSVILIKSTQRRFTKMIDFT